MNYVITVEGEVPENWYEKGFVADLAFDIVAIEPVDHRLAGVRAPRVFKEGLAPKAVGAECRELTADKVDIEGHDHSIHFAEKISAALPHAGQGLR